MLDLSKDVNLFWSNLDFKICVVRCGIKNDGKFRTIDLKLISFYKLIYMYIYIYETIIYIYICIDCFYKINIYLVENEEVCKTKVFDL